MVDNSLLERVKDKAKLVEAVKGKVQTELKSQDDPKVLNELVR
jgi:hypothetical protein